MKAAAARAGNTKPRAKPVDFSGVCRCRRQQAESRTAAPRPPGRIDTRDCRSRNALRRCPAPRAPSGSHRHPGSQHADHSLAGAAAAKEHGCGLEQPHIVFGEQPPQDLPIAQRPQLFAASSVSPSNCTRRHASSISSGSATPLRSATLRARRARVSSDSRCNSMPDTPFSSACSHSRVGNCSEFSKYSRRQSARRSPLERHDALVALRQILVFQRDGQIAFARQRREIAALPGLRDSARRRARRARSSIAPASDASAPAPAVASSACPRTSASPPAAPTPPPLRRACRESPADSRDARAARATTHPGARCARESDSARTGNGAGNRGRAWCRSRLQSDSGCRAEALTSREPASSSASR